MITQSETTMLRSMIISTFLLLVSPTLFGFGSNEPDTDIHLRISSCNCTADDGDMDIVWQGNHPWTDTDRDFYTVTISISPAAPEDFTLLFYVKEDRTAWRDPTLGSFLIEVKGEATTASGQFWLVGTQKKKVLGNEGKGDDDHAIVYLESSPWAFNVDQDNWDWEFTASRPEFEVNLK